MGLFDMTQSLGIHHQKGHNLDEGNNAIDNNSNSIAVGPNGGDDDESPSFVREDDVADADDATASEADVPLAVAVVASPVVVRDIIIGHDAKAKFAPGGYGGGVHGKSSFSGGGGGGGGSGGTGGPSSGELPSSGEFHDVQTLFRNNNNNEKNEAREEAADTMVHHEKHSESDENNGIKSSLGNADVKSGGDEAEGEGDAKSGGTTPFYNVESMFRNNNNGNDAVEGASSTQVYHKKKSENEDDNNGIESSLGTADNNVGGGGGEDDPELSPPAGTVATFNNNNNLMRDNANNEEDDPYSSTMAHHQKNSGNSNNGIQSSLGTATTNTATTTVDSVKASGFRNYDEEDDYASNNTLAHHQKNSGSSSKNGIGSSLGTVDVPTPPPPAPAVFTSLRDVHQASNSKNADHPKNVLVHSKYSQEKNAQNNPDDAPKGWDSSSADPFQVGPNGGYGDEGNNGNGNGGNGNTNPARVNPNGGNSNGGSGNGGGGIGNNGGINPDTGSPYAQDELPTGWGINPDGTTFGGSISDGDCLSKNGVYFSKGANNVRNGGVVLRYQYELVQEAKENNSDGTLFLMEDILPPLEGRISDGLIPVFFEECLNDNNNNNNDGDDNTIDQQEGGDGQQSGRGLRRRRRNREEDVGLDTVIGIDSNPDDFPLFQQECETRYVAGPNEATQCHRVEGALTLHFPPNKSLSSLLPAATLTTLRAIEQGMSNGSLKAAHGDIKKLHFLQSSYGLEPTVLPKYDDGTPTVLEDDADTEEGTNWGLILGILIPLLLLCCCCACFFCWRRRKNRVYDDDDDEDYDEESSYGSRSETVSETKVRVQMEDYARRQRALNEGGPRGQDSGVPQQQQQGAVPQPQGPGSVYSYRTRSVASSSRRSRDDTETGTESEEDQSTESSSDSDDSSTEGMSVSPSAAMSQSNYGEEEASSSDSGDDSEDESEDSRDAFPTFNPLDTVFQEAERERAKKKKAKRRQSRMRKRYAKFNKNKNENNNNSNVNPNIVMTGGVPGDEESVKTGATGMHSMSSQATTQVKNNTQNGVWGNTADGASVMSGATGATRKASNTASGGDGASVMTGATRKASNTSGMPDLPDIGIVHEGRIYSDDESDSEDDEESYSEEESHSETPDLPDRFE